MFPQKFYIALDSRRYYMTWFTLPTRTALKVAIAAYSFFLIKQITHLIRNRQCRFFKIPNNYIVVILKKSTLAISF